MHRGTGRPFPTQTLTKLTKLIKPVGVNRKKFKKLKQKNSENHY